MATTHPLSPLKTVPPAQRTSLDAASAPPEYGDEKRPLPAQDTGGGKFMKTLPPLPTPPRPPPPPQRLNGAAAVPARSTSLAPLPTPTRPKPYLPNLPERAGTLRILRRSPAENFLSTPAKSHSLPPMPKPRASVDVKDAKQVKGKPKGPFGLPALAGAVEMVENALGVPYLVAAMDTAAESLGGYDKMDLAIAAYHPPLYAFVAESPLSALSLTNRPVKFVFFFAALSLLKTFLPIFAYPIDGLTRAVSFAFMAYLCYHCLRIGFASGTLATSLLVTVMLSTALDLVPPAVVDLETRIGPMFALVVPLVLLLCPPGGTSLALQIADHVGHFGSRALNAIPESVTAVLATNIGVQLNTCMVIGGMGALFWTGCLGEHGCAATTWALLTLQTVRVLATPKPDPPATRDTQQPYLSTSHHLLAMWLARLVVSVIERIEVPRLVSVRGILTTYLPTYYLWEAAVFVAMAVTDYADTGTHADAWYTRLMLQLAASKQ